MPRKRRVNLLTADHCCHIIKLLESGQIDRATSPFDDYSALQAVLRRMGFSKAYLKTHQSALEDHIFSSLN